MKTINQVLLALIFVALSSVGIAQSQTTLPVNRVLLNDDIRFEDYTDNDDDDDDTAITDAEEVAIIRTLTQSNRGHNFQDSPYEAWIPRRD